LGARLFQRPHRALPDVPCADCGALPLLRIGLEQVVDISLVGALPGDPYRLWSAAHEHVAAKSLARHEMGRDFTHGMQALQPEGKECGKLRPGRLTFLGLLGRKQELRFEKSEPGCHDEIVGGDLKADAARLGDEVEILLGEREDGDLGDVDLLRAGEREQKIERAFEALDIDHQRVARPRLEPWVLVLPIADHLRFAWLFAHRRLVRAHATLVPAASVTSAMASASSKGCGLWKNLSARPKRSAASPSSGGTA